MEHKLIYPLHTSLRWKPIFPIDFKGFGLPGSKRISAIGKFGSVCIQEFRHEHYSIRFNVVDSDQPLVIRTRTKEPGIHARFIMKGQSRHELGESHQWSLSQNQFSLVISAKPEIISRYDDPLHISFDTFFSGKMIRAMQGHFPSLGPLCSWEPLLLNSGQEANEVIISLLQSIIHCKYDEKMRIHFFTNSVYELMLNYLWQTMNNRPAEGLLSAKDFNAIQQAGKMIAGNMTDASVIPALPGKLSVDDILFTQFFRKEFGTEPFDYLARIRMEVARTRIQNGTTIPEAARDAGYRPADFIRSFRDYFGCLPGREK